RACCRAKLRRNAPLAQLDRASDFGSEGWGFESLRAHQPSILQRAERRTLIAIAAVTLVLRALAYFRYRFDSDEPQHLHVAWGWATGLVQYRDVFDNHAPLFHILSAPLLKILGERDDVLLYMRAPMLVLFATVIATTWIIAKRFWSERIALWSVVLLATFPPYFLKSLEYRTDNLWTAVWMLALVALLAGAPFLAGVLLGIALCVSLKTVLLITTIAVAAIITAMLRDEKVAYGNAIKLFAGFVIAPAIISAYFASIGAWQNFLFGVMRFNELVTRGRHDVVTLRVIYPFALIFVIWRAREIARRGPTDRTRFFLGVASAIFSITLIGFWVLISPRDFLPIMPLFAIQLTASLIERKHATPILASIALAFLISTSYYAEWFRNGTLEQVTMIRQVLGVTKPGEYLMDYKGETIFRRRPYYFIFEKIGRGAMHRGLLRDTIAESMIRTNCHVAQADGPFWPPRAKQFLIENFIDIGRLRVSGQWIREDGTFSIAIAGDYAILDRNGETIGALDGT